MTDVERSQPEKLTVFYDGSCPMCRSEIAFYRKRKGADSVAWVDVSAAQGDVTHGLSCEAAMRRFHVQLPGGALLSGGAAFTALWRQMPAFRWAGIIGGVPPISWALAAGYALFLPLRPHMQRFFA